MTPRSQSQQLWRTVAARLEIPAIGALALAFQLPFFDRAMFVMDEGHILQFADLLANGGELYRDATLLPLPGTFYLLAAAFKLFGPSIAVARWIAVVEFALLCVFGFSLLRRLVSRRLAYVGLVSLFVYRLWAFPHWHMYSYSTMALCLLAGGLVALTSYLTHGNRWALALSGLLTGLAVSCKQDYGVAGLVAMNGVLWLRHATARPPSPERGARTFGWYNAPAIGVGAVVAFHYLRVGLFGEMLQQTLFNHLFGIATFEYSSLPPLFPLFAQEPLFRSPYGFAVYVPSIVFQVDWDALRSSAFYRDTYLWDLSIKTYFFAPYAVIAFGALRLWWIREQARDPVRRNRFLCEAALFGFAALQIVALNKPVDYVHVVVHYWPLLLLGVVYASAAVAGRPRVAIAMALIAIAPAAVVITYTGRLALRLHEQYQTPLRGDRAGVYVLPDEERVIGSVVDWVQGHSLPGERFTVLPYFPLVSFLADRDGPHRATYTFWPIQYLEDRDRQIIEAIDATGNDRLVYHFTQFVVFPRMPEYAPELFAWMVDEFEIERIFTSRDWGYMVAGARRSKGPPPGHPLIEPDDRDVEVWTEAPDGSRQPLDAVARHETFATALWPLRPVFTLRPLAGGRKSVAAIELDVPPAARLETAVSVHPEKWFDHPPSWVRYQIHASVDGHRVPLYDRTLRPHTDARDRNWFEIDVDLSPYAGRHIELQFVTQCERPNGEIASLGGWEIPRLVAPEAR